MIRPVPDPALERIAVYDAKGRVVGEAARGEVYARSLWHGTAATLLRSTDGRRVYVHRRTDDKLVMAGLHDCWAGGVIDAGESPDDAAERELAEELGISGVPLQHLFTLGWDSCAEGTDTGPGTGPHGLRAHVFAYQAFSDGPVTHQASEIAEGGWMEVEELRTRLADPSWPFVPDGRAAARRWLNSRFTDG
ncbi:NUDIX domain-containing protein [Pseudonocardia sp. KRD-291]|nr:NUDIX domain-containing protein [Pseudonocardia sp. KRD291]